MSWFKKCLQEPMLYFFMVGVVLFWIYPDTGEGARSLSDPIVLKKSLAHVSSNDVATKTAIERYVSDEALYREAWKNQLYQNDVIVRNRLIQKMRFALESDIAANPPSQAEMQAYYAAHQDQYMNANQWHFEQVFYKDSRSLSDDTLKQIGQNLQQQKSEPISADAFYLGNEFRHQDEQKLRYGFGDEFVDELKSLDVNKTTWQGPIKSLYGWHFIKISQKITANPQSFSAAQPQIYETMMKEKQEKQLQQKIQELTQKYPIAYE